MQEMDNFYEVANPEPIEAKIRNISSMLSGAGPSAVVLLAWERGELAGFASYSYLWPAAGTTRSLYLKELYVRSGYRRSGVGQALMERLFGIAREKGCSRIEWTTDRGNCAAQEFYRGIGAEPRPAKLFYRVELGS
jgi:GNAT superfamily N-acetyltransferase